MSEAFTHTHEVEQTAAIIEEQLHPGGFLYEIAATKVDSLPEGATSEEVAEIVLPQPKGGEPLQPRWTLLEKAEAASGSRAAIATNGERIVTTAEVLGLRRLVGGDRGHEDIAQIRPEEAVFVVEGGANKSSIVRRGVAERAMRAVYGDNLFYSAKKLYQLGTGRMINPTRIVEQPNGEKKTTPNPEYQTIRDLAGEFLPAEGGFTEYAAALATACADGYEPMSSAQNEPGVVRRNELAHPDRSRPWLMLMQPEQPSLTGGFDALAPIIAGRQLVIATNCQYREKDAYQAAIWARTRGVDMLPPVVLGDEPGDSFPFAGGEIAVPPRAEAAYINELIILWRLANRRMQLEAEAV